MNQLKDVLNRSPNLIYIDKFTNRCKKFVLHELLANIMQEVAAIIVVNLFLNIRKLVDLMSIVIKHIVTFNIVLTAKHNSNLTCQNRRCTELRNRAKNNNKFLINC